MHFITQSNMHGNVREDVRGASWRTCTSSKSVLVCASGADPEPVGATPAICGAWPAEPRAESRLPGWPVTLPCCPSVITCADIVKFSHSLPPQSHSWLKGPLIGRCRTHACNNYRGVSHASQETFTQGPPHSVHI